MPQIRACHLRHPVTGEDGLWIERTQDKPGTLVGRAKSAFPAVAGMTLNQYEEALNVNIATLTGVRVTVDIKLSSINTISEITVT